MLKRHAFLSALFISSAQLACEEPIECTSIAAVVSLKLVDSLNNPVTIDAVRLVPPDGRGGSCDEIKSREGVANCNVIAPGDYTALISAQGRTLTYEHIMVGEYRDPDRCYLQPGGLNTFVYDGPLCDPSTLELARGEMFGTDGLPTDQGKVTIRGPEGQTGGQCTMQGTRFSCIAPSALSGDYEIEARVGASVLTQTISVQINECQVAPAELRFDRSMWPCEEGEEEKPALRVLATVQNPTTNMPRNVVAESVRASDSFGNQQDCVLEPESAKPAERGFLCAATTPNGGGSYLVDVTYAGRTQSLRELVLDDGCQPNTGVVRVMF